MKDLDAAKKPPQKIIQINIIIANSKEFELTSWKKKRNIKEVTLVYQRKTWSA